MIREWIPVYLGAIALLKASESIPNRILLVGDDLQDELRRLILETFETITESDNKAIWKLLDGENENQLASDFFNGIDVWLKYPITISEPNEDRFWQVDTWVYATEAWLEQHPQWYLEDYLPSQTEAL